MSVSNDPTTTDDCFECGTRAGDCDCDAPFVPTPAELARMRKEMEQELQGAAAEEYDLDAPPMGHNQPYVDDYQDNWLDDCRFSMLGE